MSMPPVLTESARTSARSRTTLSNPNNPSPHREPADVLKSLEEHILMDGFRIVIDLERSRGSYLYDAATGHRLIDFYGFFGSLPVGFTPPRFDEPEGQRGVL